MLDRASLKLSHSHKNMQKYTQRDAQLLLHNLLADVSNVTSYTAHTVITITTGDYYV